MNNAKGTVRIQQQTTEDFTIEERLRQGDGLAPVLFNILLNKVIKDMDIDNNGTILTKKDRISANQII